MRRKKGGAKKRRESKRECAAREFARARRLWVPGRDAPLERRLEAMKWYKRAAQSGLPKYAGVYGDILCNEDRTETANFRAGYRWLLRAAEAGDTDAQYWVARELATGENMRRNPKRGAYWYRRAALRGLASAQYNLGIMYSEGDGVPKNDARSRRWILKAAKNGEYFATVLLAEAYVNGIFGFPIDAAKAAYWKKRLEKLED